VASAEATLACVMSCESACSRLLIAGDQILASKLDPMPKEFDLSLKMEQPVLPAPGTCQFI
jgi:hypothetical protein